MKGEIKSTGGASEDQSARLGTYEIMNNRINGKVAYQWQKTNGNHSEHSTNNQTLYWTNDDGGYWWVRKIIRIFLLCIPSISR